MSENQAEMHSVKLDQGKPDFTLVDTEFLSLLTKELMMRGNVYALEPTHTLSQVPVMLEDGRFVEVAARFIVEISKIKSCSVYEALVFFVRVMEGGAKKYSRDNWKIDLDPTRTTGAILRHFLQHCLEGHDDKEWNLPHLAHGVCELMFTRFHKKRLENANKSNP